jgi:hypothetical protein
VAKDSLMYSDCDVNEGEAMEASTSKKKIHAGLNHNEKKNHSQLYSVKNSPNKYSLGAEDSLDRADSKHTEDRGRIRFGGELSNGQSPVSNFNNKSAFRPINDDEK